MRSAAVITLPSLGMLSLLLLLEILLPLMPLFKTSPYVALSLLLLLLLLLLPLSKRARFLSPSSFTSIPGAAEAEERFLTFCVEKGWDNKWEADRAYEAVHDLFFFQDQNAIQCSLVLLDVIMYALISLLQKLFGIFEGEIQEGHQRFRVLPYKVLSLSPGSKLKL
jgi:hypothetical protein